MEQPYEGCQASDAHQDACLLDILTVLETIYTSVRSDHEVMRWWHEHRPDMHLCHLESAMRQLVSFAHQLALPPGDITEHIAGQAMNMAIPEWPP